VKVAPKIKSERDEEIKLVGKVDVTEEWHIKAEKDV
jgi:hypothetical protein